MFHYAKPCYIQYTASCGMRQSSFRNPPSAFRIRWVRTTNREERFVNMATDLERWMAAQRAVTASIAERLHEWRTADPAAGWSMRSEPPADGFAADDVRADGLSPGPTGEGHWSDAVPSAPSPSGLGGRPEPVPIGGHTLPPLPYPYDALEPWIDEETMRLHHDKHHKSYVDGLNQAERMMAEARKTGDFALLKHWEREAAFHGAGHYLHTIFWCVMGPDGGGKPAGALLSQIERDFGSFDAFKAHFSQAAEKVEG